MDQVIRLEKNDDILQVQSKIEWSDGRRVIVVVPRGSRAFDAEHEMRLLRRYAEHADAQVALVSTDYTVRELAATVGVPIFSSVDKASRSSWKWNGREELSNVRSAL